MLALPSSYSFFPLDSLLLETRLLQFLLMDEEMYSSMSCLNDASPTIERGIALHKMIHFITMALGGEDYLNFMGNEVAGAYHWKHGCKGAGVIWLHQSQDTRHLDRSAQHLFDSVEKTISDESFKQCEGIIELLGSESKPVGGLEFLNKYRDFKIKSIQMVYSGKSTDVARQVVGSLIRVLIYICTLLRLCCPQ